MTLVLVLVGGAVGAPTRYLTDIAVQHLHRSSFPWGTWTVNMVGSFILGLVVAAGASSWATTLVGTGFCGALTTFSTFGYETVRLSEEGETGTAVVNVAASLTLGLTAAALGWWAGSLLGAERRVCCLDVSMEPESAEDFYARVERATGPDGRLEIAVEEMPGWDVFPFELDSLVMKPLHPLAEAEPPRGGEDPAECWCARPLKPDADERRVWQNERWRLHLDSSMRLPIGLTLGPLDHHDLNTLPDDLAAEMGILVVAVAAAVEALPSVGRVQVAKYGDGGAHLHLFFLARPARMLQLRGSPLLDWEENLPRVPLEVTRANAELVARQVVARVGGEGPGWL